MQKENYDFVQQIECTNQHICPAARDCVFCQVNFKYISENPFEIKCGHVICETCREKNGNAMRCKQHGLAKILKRSNLAELISARKSELFQFLNDEYNAIWSSYNSNT